MNVTRGLRLLPALALALTVASGVVAQSDSQPVSVVLTDSTEPCAIDIYPDQRDPGTFGAWQFDSGPGAFVNMAGSSTRYFWGDVWVPTLKGCDVSISFGGLSNGTDTIGATHFAAWSVYQSAAVSSAGFGDTSVGAGLGGDFAYYDFNYTLESVPLISLGTYTGNIDAVVSNTA